MRVFQYCVARFFVSVLTLKLTGTTLAKRLRYESLSDQLTCVPKYTPQHLENFIVNSNQTQFTNDLKLLDLDNNMELIKRVLKTELLERIEMLSTISEDKSRPGVTRPYFSEAGREARLEISRMMRASGLSSRTDAVGNVIGDLKCTKEENTSGSKLSSELGMDNRGVLLMASHFDAVPNGGKWDGTYGIIAAMGVAQLFSPYICSLPFDLQVVAFDDEEGASGYGVTNFGVKSFVGAVNVSRDLVNGVEFSKKFASVFRLLESDSDVERHSTGIVSKVSRCIESAGVSEVQKGSYIAALELHIEQGPKLQATGHSVAAVSAIAGQTRLTVTWTGENAHAGTVPMDTRYDALLAASQAALAVERTAINQDCVVNEETHKVKVCKKRATATVGKLEVVNSGTNVVPGHVWMSVDVRAANDNDRRTMIGRMEEEFFQISKQRGVSFEIENVHDVEAVQMAPWVERLLSSVSDSPQSLVSGAGHDTQFLSQLTGNVGMLFVRCRDGISHSPDEYVDEEDAFSGSFALLKAVDALAIKLR